MNRFIPQLTRQELWSLVDPRLTDPAVVAVMEQILELVGSCPIIDCGCCFRSMPFIR